MVDGPNDWYDVFLPAETQSMSAGLTLLTDDELTKLRERIVQLTRTATPEQRAMVSGQLETIDLERDRRLSAPSNPDGSCQPSNEGVNANQRRL
jgi:hypothetical protein